MERGRHWISKLLRRWPIIIFYGELCNFMHDISITIQVDRTGRLTVAQFSRFPVLRPACNPKTGVPPKFKFCGGKWLVNMVLVEEDLSIRFQGCHQNYSIMPGWHWTKHGTRNLKVPLDSLLNSDFNKYHDSLFPSKEFEFRWDPRLRLQAGTFGTEITKVLAFSSTPTGLSVPPWINGDTVV